MEDAGGDDSNEASIEDIRNNNNLPSRKWFILWLHASIMCGREFLYAVEIVFVTPIILQLGMPEKYYSFMWCFSPIISVLVGPLLGSSSDRCTSRFGRRRPYIVGLVIGALIGLTFLIFSKDLAAALGGSNFEDRRLWGIVVGIIGAQFLDFCLDQTETPLRAYTLDVCSIKDQQRAFALQTVCIGVGGALGFVVDGIDWESTALSSMIDSQIKVVYFFAVFAYVTTAICNLASVKEIPLSLQQANTRSNATLTTRVVTSQIPRFNEPNTFQLASCADESTQTLAENTKYSLPPNAHSQTGRITPSILVSICENDDVYQAAEEDFNPSITPHPASIDSQALVSTRVSNTTDHTSKHIDTQSTREKLSGSNTSKKEEGITTPTRERKKNSMFNILNIFRSKENSLRTKTKIEQDPIPSHYTVKSKALNECQTQLLHSSTVDKLEKKDLYLNHSKIEPLIFDENSSNEKYLNLHQVKTVNGNLKKNSEKTKRNKKHSTLKKLWLSLSTMPSQLKWLCLCQLLGFIGYETIMLWYTDLMGRVIYEGDPQAPSNSSSFAAYNAGVKMGCWGLAVYSCAMVLFSVLMERLRILKRFSIRILYSYSFLLMTAAMIIMFIFANKYVILALSWTIGVSVAVLLTVPYVLVGKYHLNLKYVRKSPGKSKRGFGLDCAILACQMYAGNVISAVISSPVIHFSGTCKAMLLLTGACNLAAFLFAYLFVTYPGEGRSSCQTNDMVERSTETIDAL